MRISRTRQPRRWLFFVLLIILLVVTIEAPVGYVLGFYNWTEYHREHLRIGGGETESGHNVKLAAGDSLRLRIDFDQNPSLSSSLTLVPADRWPCMSGCYKVEVADVLHVTPDVGRTIELYYTTTTGGDFVWFAAGLNKPLAGFVPGAATLTISRLYLVLIPLIATIVLLVMARRNEHDN